MVVFARCIGGDSSLGGGGSFCFFLPNADKRRMLFLKTEFDLCEVFVATDSIDGAVSEGGDLYVELGIGGSTGASVELYEVGRVELEALDGSSEDSL